MSNIPEGYVLLPKDAVKSLTEVVNGVRGWLYAYSALFPQGPPTDTGKPIERQQFVDASNILSNTLIGWKEQCAIMGGEPNLAPGGDPHFGA
ncbi:MAG TPA: hypothetical protein VFH61_08135 [Thermoleophilia bacterium]|nr:hypothetical protein [Thermoleophilia bacterium]